MQNSRTSPNRQKKRPPPRHSHHPPDRANPQFLSVLAPGGQVEISMPSSSVQVRVPASTSNLGPGFDCLGLALRLYNTTTITRADGARPLQGMIAETAAAF